jgi:hypothetical protein
MMKDEFLDRARRSLRLARLHHGLRDVSAEVTDVREALAAAGSQPAAIGITEDELVALVRGGYLAEARLTFDLAVDGAATALEKDFFFSELVTLIAKAAISAAPRRPTVREQPLTAAPADEPLAEEDVETLKAEKERLAGRIAALDRRIDEIRAETDRKAAEYLERNDPFLRNEPSGCHELRALMADVTDEAIDSLDFSRLEGGTLDLPTAAVRIPDDDPDPVIEIDVADIDGEVLLEIVEPNPEYDRFAVQFFGEKDAIALGFAPAQVVVLPPPRIVPPPLPKEALIAASTDDA